MGVVADASAAVALNIASVAARAPSTILIPLRSSSIPNNRRTAIVSDRVQTEKVCGASSIAFRRLA